MINVGLFVIRSAPFLKINSFPVYCFKPSTIEISSKEKSVLSGLNFWGFAGFAKTNEKNGKWEVGDDFSADPPQEPQGLNSVFASDTSTLNLIKKYNDGLQD